MLKRLQMHNYPLTNIFKEYRNHLKVLIIVLSFIIPFILLYHMDANSFNMTWKGRTYYLFFIWFFILGLVLNWEKYGSGTANKLRSMRRIIVFGATLTLPTFYVFVANFFGLNVRIVDLAEQLNIPWAHWMPLSIEYLVFTIFFVMEILLAYGLSSLGDFSLPYLLGTIGIVYTIDNLYPYGRFTPFQIFVPTTTMLAANVLNLMRYRTQLLGLTNGMPTLAVWGSKGGFVAFQAAWPCSGVDSLLIYTVTILLFLKKVLFLGW